MRLKTKKIIVDYRGEKIECEKTIYCCDFCDFELHEKWMQEKMEKQLEELYTEKTAGTGEV